ncbi:MAG: nucleotidyltransferase substrate binding protein [Armatimonadota bacterium]
MLDLSSLKKAIISLDELLGKTTDVGFMNTLDDISKKGLKADVIQNFEFTYELCWKFMKRWLEINLGSTYVDGVPRNELFRISAEHRLIDNVENWFEYHKARNITSHTYNEIEADRVFNTAKSFISDAKILLKNLEAKND